jgi:hypothetical protein
VTITIEQRGDGGIRIYSDDVKGVRLSARYPWDAFFDLHEVLAVLKPELFEPIKETET